MSTANDTELMREVRGGRTGALATLFERHHARLYRFCLKMTGDRQASEDLVQDVFMKMLKYRRTFRGDTAFAPWMFRIARNACVDHLRRSTPDAVPSDHSGDRRGGEPLAADHPSDERPVEERAAEDERAALVRRALLTLPVDRREVLVLSRYEFKTYEEIAGALGCSVGAVKVRAHRAMKQLRQIYLALSQEVPT